MSRSETDDTPAPEVTPSSQLKVGEQPETLLWVTKLCETCKQPFVSRPCKKSIFCCRKCKLDSPRIRARLSESAKARKGGDGPFSSKAASIRLLTKKQMHTPEAREAAARARRARGNWRPPVQGGNGRPMPKPQQMLLEALGPDWVSEKRFPWGRSAI